ncbi:hypothetical protein BJX68DRAFT_222348 [Aspergillus pseudodeflectus]|uniref:Uncharacterized protein n=1 Tax=Aspergillus pseudodeflectus TaxID=176178 RepID=A0ABR4LA04_9EURO
MDAHIRNRHLPTNLPESEHSMGHWMAPKLLDWKKSCQTSTYLGKLRQRGCDCAIFIRSRPLQPRLASKGSSSRTRRPYRAGIPARCTRTRFQNDVAATYVCSDLLSTSRSLFAISIYPWLGKREGGPLVPRNGQAQDNPSSPTIIIIIIEQQSPDRHSCACNPQASQACDHLPVEDTSTSTRASSKGHMESYRTGRRNVKNKAEHKIIPI